MSLLVLISFTHLEEMKRQLEDNNNEAPSESETELKKIRFAPPFEAKDHIKIAVEAALIKKPGEENLSIQPIVLYGTCEDWETPSILSYWPATQEIGEKVLHLLESTRESVKKEERKQHKRLFGIFEMIATGRTSNKRAAELDTHFGEDSWKGLGFFGIIKSDIDCKDINEDFYDDVDIHVVGFDQLSPFVYRLQCLFDTETFLDDSESDSHSESDSSSEDC